MIQTNGLLSILLSTSLYLLSCVVGMGTASAQVQTGIEGKWKEPQNGGIILIYEMDGMYYGQLIGSAKPEEDKKIKEQDEILLLRDFEKRSETEFCCGTIYQPRKNRTASGTLVLENEHTLTSEGRVGPFTKSQVWTRL